MSIRDVASRAGVSTATVSRVVSGRGYVAPETRERVLAAVADLGYVTDQLARGLKTRRTHSVGLLVPEIVNSFYTTIVRGVEDTANANGIHVIIGNTDDDTAKEHDYLRLLMGLRVDGIVIAPAGGASPGLSHVIRRGIPTVLIDRTVEGVAADRVHSDNESAARALTRYLLARGFRRIALVNGDATTSVAMERSSGYTSALNGAGIPVLPNLISDGPWTAEDAQRRTAELLRSSPLPDVIFAANNFLALGALRALRSLGVASPETLPVACFDALSLFVTLDPLIAAMDQPAREMGEVAMRLLLDRISGAYTGAAREIVLPSMLITRDDVPALGFAGQSPAALVARGHETRAAPIETVHT